MNYRLTKEALAELEIIRVLHEMMDIEKHLK